MKATIKLFRAVEIKDKYKTRLNKRLLPKTVRSGFIFAPEVIGNYSEEELDDLFEIVDKEIGLSAEQMNTSFHKSWNKVKEASIEQLVLEQLVHYITTYGFEHAGLYDKDSVYIPNEILEVPELEDGIRLRVIKGYTKEELKDKLLSLIGSGIALKEDTVNDILEVAVQIGINEEDIDQIKNKEIKVALYDRLGLFPENPIEFLRYVVYKTIGKTLLIKDNDTITAIKEADIGKNSDLFFEYINKYGLEKLAQVFFRFKPIFLAFKTDNKIRESGIINRIRKLANIYHKPMPEDFLNEITSKIAKKEEIDINKLNKELDRVNIFRKIRLAYALKYRTLETESILYRLRNGKGYAKPFSYTGSKTVVNNILNLILNSISNDIAKNVKGKKIYIPDNMIYALPATEKQFTGEFPSGSYISIPKDMVMGIFWKNVKKDGIRHRIDLDLSIINATDKFGWDADYRSPTREILFSGDITDPPKKGATELFFIAKQSLDFYIVFVNYYNFLENSGIEVPMQILIAQEEIKDKKAARNYTVNPNNVIATANTSINKSQKLLGFLVTTTGGSKFYFAETYLGKTITADSTCELVKHGRQFLFDFYRNTINLNDMLCDAEAEIVEDREEADIDLSPENLEKDTIINLIS